MADKRNRVILAIIGFFIFIIPLFFFCYTLNKEYEFNQNRIQENLKEKLIKSANKLEENLDCYSYLKYETNKIHHELFPECPEEVLDKIPEDSLTKNLYTKELLGKIIAKTKDKFSPVMITLGTDGFKELYGYYSSELEKDLGNKKNENDLLEAKSYYDMELILDKYYYYFKKDYYKDRRSKEKAFYFYKLDEQKLIYIDGITMFSRLCYKYISRFSQYSRANEPLYTDYFSKQSLFSIVKYTLSKKGIHGFYTLLIPQSQIHPASILRYAKSKIDSDVIMTTENKNGKSELNQNDNGFEYRFNFSSIFKNHVNVFKKLRKIDKTFILNKQIKLSIDYPNEYIVLEKINIAVKILAVLATLFYIALAIIFKEYLPSRNIKLSRKLIYVLSIIIILPILGIGILTLTLSHNLDELVDISVSKNLHNSLENYALIDNEISTRIFSSIIEMKKKIRQNSLPDLKKHSLIDTFESKKTKRWNETLKWFNSYNSDLAIFSENGKLYLLDNDNGFSYRDNKTELLIQTLLQKYMNNLSLTSTKRNKSQEIFALSLLDQYINHKVEEKSVSQESILSNDFIFLSNFNNSAYYYAKDKGNINYLLYSKINGKNNRPYKFLHNYALTNPLWYQPNYKYAYDTNLAITHYYNDTSKENNRLQFPISSFHNNINNLLDRILDKSESGYEIINNKDESTINEYIFSNNTPFVIAGTTKSLHNNNLALTTKLLFPFLISYAIIILILLSNLISAFIKKPIDIYKEALESLENNHFGTTIESFSKDEFNSITSAFNEMSVAIKQKEQIKRYVSDKLIQSVESNRVLEVGDGKQEKVTILSSDIRNFTAISEQYEPYVIVEMLNTYFTRMQQTISDNGGIIDKYIGDAIQAVFYEEPNKENQVIRASKAAIAMRKALKEYNEERKKENLFTIENGIGIDTDSAITGTIGTQDGRKDFSVNGDVVARAANLESKTKQTQSKILISRNSLKEIKSDNTSGIHSVDVITKDFDKESVELIDVR